MNYLRPADCLPESDTQVIVWGTLHGKKVWTIGVYEDGTVLRDKSKWHWSSNGFENLPIVKGWYAIGDCCNRPLDFDVEYWAEIEEP